MLNQYTNYQKIFNENEINFIKIMIDTTNIVKYKNCENDTAFRFMAKLVNDFEIMKHIPQLATIISTTSKEIKWILDNINEITIKLINNDIDQNNLELVERNFLHSLATNSQQNKNFQAIAAKNTTDLPSSQPSTSGNQLKLPKM